MLNAIEGRWSETDWYGEVVMDGVVLDHRPSLRVANHSPDGFAWGYQGSGPAQLALAILLNVGVAPSRALLLYVEFMDQFVAAVHDRAPFRLRVDVLGWVLERATLCP